MSLFTRKDFELLHPTTGQEALEASTLAIEKLGPRLRSIANDMANRIARSEGLFLFPHTASRPPKGEMPKQGMTPGSVELLAASSRHRSSLNTQTWLGIGLTHTSISCHIIVPADCEDGRRMGGGLRENSVQLSRHHAGFGLLRNYAGWDGVGLPETVPSKSPAFWDTMGVRLSESPEHWLDLGLSLTGTEAAEANLEDLLKIFNRLMPLYGMAAKEGYKPFLR